jgi:transposase
MRPKHSGQSKAAAERVVKDIRRATRRSFSAEDKIQIVSEGLRGDDSIANLTLENRLLKKSIISHGGDDK